MPNRPNLGLSAVGSSGVAAPTSISGSVAGGAATAAFDVWASDATGVPQLVWTTNPRQVVSPVAAWDASTRLVTVTWTLPTPRAADGYLVYRQDGSLVGTAPGGEAALSITDAAANGLNAPYQVVTTLGGVVSSAVASNTLDMRPSPVTTVAASYSPTQVGLTWVRNANRIADSFVVKRPDGSVAGTAVGADAVSFIDTSPLPLSGAYTVTAMRGTVAATAAASNSLNLSTGPASVSAVPGNISWTNPAYGAPDSFDVYVAGVFYANVVGNSTFAAFAPGLVSTVTVYANLSGVDGGSTSTTVAQPAQTPVVQQISSRYTLSGGGSGAISVRFSHPAAGTWTGFEAEAYDTYTNTWHTCARFGGPYDEYGTLGTGVPGWWRADYDVPSYGFYPSGVSVYVHVRSLSAGGASAWVQCGPIPQTDTAFQSC